MTKKLSKAQLLRALARIDQGIPSIVGIEELKACGWITYYQVRRQSFSYSQATLTPAGRAALAQAQEGK